MWRPQSIQVSRFSTASFCSFGRVCEQAHSRTQRAGWDARCVTPRGQMHDSSDCVHFFFFLSFFRRRSHFLCRSFTYSFVFLEWFLFHMFVDWTNRFAPQHIQLSFLDDKAFNFARGTRRLGSIASALFRPRRCECWDLDAEDSDRNTGAFSIGNSACETILLRY